MKQVLLLSFVLLSFFAQAQTSLIKGRIVDAEKDTGIAYTNIGVEGTFYGTASDADGYFELKIPAEFLNKRLFVSAVGYENQNYAISELVKKDFAALLLNEQTYSITGVDVAAQSRVLFRIIRTAAENIASNYWNGPFNQQFHYLERHFEGDSALQVREAIVEMSDASGYAQPSVTNAYSSRNYKYTEVNKNFASTSFAQGTTGFDELLEQDLARLSNTIFKEELINDYDLHLDGEAAYQGDSIWIISYKATKPDLAHTGDYYANKMDGKLYIAKSNYALLRHDCVIEAAKNSPQNRSLYTASDAMQQVSYHQTTLYQKYGAKYAASYFDQDKSYISPDGTQRSISRKAALLDLQPNQPLLQSRSYFEDAAYDEKFWTSFHSQKKL